MKVIFNKNTLHKGKRFLVGQKVEFADDVAKKFIKDSLARAEKDSSKDDKNKNQEGKNNK